MKLAVPTRDVYPVGVNRIFLCIALLTLMLLAGPSAWAQASEQPDVVYQENTVLTFGDDTIDGSLSRPDGQYLESRKKLRHERLIRVRRSFRSRLLHSIHGLH